MTSTAAEADQAPAWAGVERIGPPNQNFIVEHVVFNPHLQKIEDDRVDVSRPYAYIDVHTQ